jgi:hypothetical protein
MEEDSDSGRKQAMSESESDDGRESKWGKTQG